MNRLILAFLSIILVLSSCTTDKVITSHAVQKRKYRTGLYFSSQHEKKQLPGMSLKEPYGNIQKKTPSLQIDREFLPVSLFKVIQEKQGTNSVASSTKSPSNENVVHKVKKGVKSALTIADKAFRVKCKPSQDYYEEQMQPRSSYGISGFTLSLLAWVFLVAAFLIQSYWALLFVLLALIVAVFGLVRSIKGLRDSYDFNRKGKFFSYFGLFASATALGISAFLAFLVLLTIVAFILV